MDRTALFVQLVEEASRQTYGGASSLYAPSPAPLTGSAFTRAAAEVGRELHATAAKVQALTKRACGFFRGRAPRTTIYTAAPPLLPHHHRSRPAPRRV